MLDGEPGELVEAALMVTFEPSKNGALERALGVGAEFFEQASGEDFVDLVPAGWMKRLTLSGKVTFARGGLVYEITSQFEIKTIAWSVSSAP